MPNQDPDRWKKVTGDHADDPTYGRRIPNPEGDVDATQGALEAAEELGVDLAEIEGTGAHGRITKSDVEAAAS